MDGSQNERNREDFLVFHPVFDRRPAVTHNKNQVDPHGKNHGDCCRIHFLAEEAGEIEGEDVVDCKRGVKSIRDSSVKND